jgi:hypothetical protein
MTVKDEMTSWEEVAIAAAASERITGVLALSASASTTVGVRSILEDIWQIASGTGRPVANDEVLAQVETMPEASVTDSRRRSYVAMRVLELVSVAVRVASGGSSVDSIDDVTLSFYASMDARRRNLERGHPCVIEPGTLREVGSLESQEQGRLSADRQLLRAHARSEGVARLRERARAESVPVQTALEQVISSYA